MIDINKILYFLITVSMFSCKQINYRSDSSTVKVKASTFEAKGISCEERLETNSMTPERSRRENLSEDYVWSSKTFGECSYESKENEIIINWDREKNWTDSINLVYTRKSGETLIHLSRTKGSGGLYENPYTYDLSKELDSVFIAIDTSLMSRDTLKAVIYTRLKLYYVIKGERLYAHRTFEGCVSCYNLKAKGILPQKSID